MRYLTSFPPDFAFSRGSGEFLFLPTKIQNIYYSDNQLVIDLRSIPRLSLCILPRLYNLVFPTVDFYNWLNPVKKISESINLNLSQVCLKFKISHAEGDIHFDNLIRCK